MGRCFGQHRYERHVRRGLAGRGSVPRNRARTACSGGLVATALALIAALSPTPAAANTTHAFELALQPASRSAQRAVAVDEATGNVFATSEINGQMKLIEIHGPNGEAPIGVKGPIEGSFNAGSGGRVQLAFNNLAGSAKQGTLYFTDRESHVVKMYQRNATSEEYELVGELGGLEEAVGVAIGDNGEVWVSNRHFVGGLPFPYVGELVEYSESGTELRRISLEGIGGPGEIVVDSSGDLFFEILKGIGENLAEGGVWEIPAAALTQPDPASSARLVTASPSRGIGIDKGSDALYVSLDEKQGVVEINLLTGKEEGVFGRAQINRSQEIAVNEATGFLYIGTEVPGGAGRTLRYGPTIQLPDVTTTGASEVATRTATLNGTVNPKELSLQTCKFLYGPTAAYGHEVPCAESVAEIGAGTSPVPVHADVSGLAPGAAYHFKLSTTLELPSGEVPTSEGEDEAFVTAGPHISGTTVLELSDTSAVIGGNINPRGHETSYQVEYAPAAQFAERGWEGAVAAPLPPGVIAGGTADVPVSAEIRGLRPNTSYRVRLVAKNGGGTAAGELDESGDEIPHQFTTFETPSPSLPDGRVYEQASPVEKDGSNVLGEPDAVQAAANGEGITFYSPVGIPGGEGAQKFPIYLASRDSDGNGWTTQGLLPPASAGPIAEILGWSQQLDQTYEAAQRVGSPPVLYQRASADRSLDMIVEGGHTAEDSYKVAGATTTGDEVLFEAAGPEPLPPGAAPGVPNAFVWDRAEGKAVTVGVMNDGQAPVDGTFAGTNAWFNPNFTEKSGASLGYALRDQNAISADGSRILFTTVADSQLYVRTNPTRAQSPVDGQGKCTDEELACTVEVSAAEPGVSDPNGLQPAKFVGATPDGGSVFFMSAAKLTADATTGPADEGQDLYRYDLEDEELEDLTSYPAGAAGAEVQGVLGISEDGSYVYVAANGSLEAGAPAGDCSAGTSALGSCDIFMLHEGGATFVGRVSPGTGPKEINGGHTLSGDQTNWAPTSNYEGLGGSREENSARVSRDGRTLLFQSVVSQTGAATEGFNELYLYRAGASAPLCVSCSPNGSPAVAGAAVQALQQKFIGPGLRQSVRTRNLSASGDRVFFDTAEKLVASDRNGVNDVYEWEAPDPTDPTDTCHSTSENGGCLFLISGGVEAEPSYFADAGEKGRDVFFFTAQQLVGQDRDRLQDVYDARIGGGIPGQTPSQAQICGDEESCRGAAPPVPVTGVPGTAGFVGPGNPPHKPHHKKKHHKKKNKPHKKKHHKTKHHGRSQGKKGAGR
jgi:hypothetical protein